MSMAYNSTLNISFEVRGGLLIRQIHHWAALLFVFSMMLHMMRIFFTGAFRKPREVNWIHRRAAADPGHGRGLPRLLAARRPAVRHRPAGGLRVHPVHPGDRHLDALGGVRRRLPRRHRSFRGSTPSTSC